MLNLATSFVTTMLSLVIGLLSYLKGPVLLISGVATLVLVLSSPAEAAQIKCALKRLSSSIWHDMGKKASFVVIIDRWFNNHLLVNNNRERGVIMIIVILLFLLNILSFLLCGYMLRNKG